MADCKKTLEFFSEYKRMCESFNCCEKCPLDTLDDEQCLNCDNAHIIIPIVQSWSDEHPVISWRAKFEELFPNADMEIITDQFCIKTFFGDDSIACADKRCISCWDEPYKEG